MRPSRTLGLVTKMAYSSGYKSSRGSGCMLPTISAALGSLNAARDIIKGLDAAHLTASLKEVKIELQGLILNAQQGLFDAQEAQMRGGERIHHLEQRIMELENW